MKYQEKSCLAYFNAAPQLSLVDLTTVPAPAVALNCKNYKNGCELYSPDKAAVEFYTLNHLASIVKAKFTENEPLPVWAQEVMAAYISCVAEQGQRMFYYLTLITTRESRHVKTDNSIKPPLDLTKNFGGACSKFNTSIKGKGSDTAVEIFLSSPPLTSLGPYLKSLHHIFYNGVFHGGYGGKPWALVAQTALSFVEGKTSMEMMLDTAYTLAHNNGPIFNKGMMYNGYTHEIYKILDIQRSGQMPEYVLSKVIGNPFDIAALVLKVAAEFPGIFGAAVDFLKVEALGSMKKYPKEIAAQKALMPQVPKFPLNKNETEIGSWAVSPTESTIIYTRTALQPA